jgi:hypothetical protein|nr:GspH/FimT family pseudopilin [Moraxella nonliquefaciens]
MGWGIVTKQKGLTLIELMVVVIVIAVISMIAYPGIMKSLQKMEANHVASIITDALKQARAQSHITKQNIIVCPADEFNLCHRQLGKKIIVFKDLDGNARLDDGELMMEHELNLKYGRLDMRVSASRHYIKYFGSSASPRGHFGHIKYCSVSDDARLSYKIILTHMGAVRKSFEDVGCGFVNVLPINK